MVALRDFIAQRETEIREQIKVLRAEQKELQVAKAALDAQGVAPATASDKATAPVTIKDMVRSVLADQESGLTSAEILAAILKGYDRSIDRTSLSPQLSRLKDSGEVVLQGEKWFRIDHFKTWQQNIVDQATLSIARDFDESSEEEYEDYQE